MKTLYRHALRGMGVAAASMGLVALGGSAAWGHVTVTPSTTEAGSYAVLSFATSHGCDGSPTTKIAIEMPEGIISATASAKPGWEATTEIEKLDKPVDAGHGSTYSERVKQIVYTADTPLADGLRDTFEISLKLPEEAGKTLTFPALQTCVKGETAWNEKVPASGEEPPHPAPEFTLTAAESASEQESDSSALSWVAIVLGGLGTLTGGTALLRGKRSA